MKILMLIALMFVSTAASAREVTGDMRRIEQPFEMTVITYESKRDLNRAANIIFNDNRKDRDGFAVWTLTKCTIHVLNLRRPTDRETLPEWGHELAHCVYGTFHK